MFWYLRRPFSLILPHRLPAPPWQAGGSHLALTTFTLFSFFKAFIHCNTAIQWCRLDGLFNCPTSLSCSLPYFGDFWKCNHLNPDRAWLWIPASLLLESSKVVPLAPCPLCLFMLPRPDDLKLLYPETLLSEKRSYYWMCFIYLENCLAHLNPCLSGLIQYLLRFFR